MGECFKYLWISSLNPSRISGPSVAGLETTYSGGNGFSTSYNSQRWLNLYLSACKLLDLALALPSESLPQFQMWVPTFSFRMNESVSILPNLNEMLKINYSTGIGGHSSLRRQMTLVWRSEDKGRIKESSSPMLSDWRSF